MSATDRGPDDADIEARVRAAHEALEAARQAYHQARHQAREASRAERAAARAERHAMRAERHRVFAGWDEHSFRFDIGGLDVGGEEHTEDVEQILAVEGMPRLRVRNVSGETRIGVGADRTVRVRARKRVRTTSADKAKRLLENVEVRIDQRGDEIEVRPHLYEQDRGWIDLFRGGRVAVDLDITVPRETRVEAHTVSGELSLVGTLGPVEVQSVSGDLSIEQVRGPLWIKTVSGDATCVGCVGQLEGNSVSGDLTLQGCRLRDVDIVTVSGDVTFDGELEGHHRFKTISGDVELGLAGDSYQVDLRTMSGDLSSDLPGATVNKEARRDRSVVIGDGRVRVEVKTVSGDLQLRRAGGTVPDAGAAAPAAEAQARTERQAPPPPASSGEEARAILERLARGDIDVDSAAAALDATRGRRGEGAPDPGPDTR